MPQRFVFFVSVIGVFALSFFNFPHVSAQTAVMIDDPCAEEINCMMSAATVIKPSDMFTYASPRSVVVTGVSWNQTHVDIYIDDAYAGRATLHEDASGIGNFYFYPKIVLTPGKHTMYTITRSMNEYDRSPQSPTITFTIARQKAVVTQKNNQTTNIPTSTIATSTPNESANSILDWFFGRSNTTTATGTGSNISRSSMDIIMALIGVAAVFGIFRWIRISRKRGRTEKIVSTDDPSPPPV